MPLGTQCARKFDAVARFSDFGLTHTSKDGSGRLDEEDLRLIAEEMEAKKQAKLDKAHKHHHHDHSRDSMFNFSVTTQSHAEEELGGQESEESTSNPLPSLSEEDLEGGGREEAGTVEGQAPTTARGRFSSGGNAVEGAGAVELGDVGGGSAGGDMEESLPVGSSAAEDGNAEEPVAASAQAGDAGTKEDGKGSMPVAAGGVQASEEGEAGIPRELSWNAAHQAALVERRTSARAGMSM